MFGVFRYQVNIFYLIKPCHGSMHVIHYFLLKHITFFSYQILFLNGDVHNAIFGDILKLDNSTVMFVYRLRP